MKDKKDHRKPVFVAALAALLVFQSLGWMGVWSALRLGARAQAYRVMRAGPANGDLKLTLSADSLLKLKVAPREIRLAGRLYDIRSAEQRGDSVALHLYHDRLEERLYALLGDLLCAGGNAPSFANHWLAQCIGAAYLVPEPTDWRIRRMPESCGPAVFVYIEPVGTPGHTRLWRPPACAFST
jgi:hypothetical protein